MSLLVVLKKLFSRVLFPVPFILLCLTAAFILLSCKGERKRKWGKWILAAGTIYLLLASMFGHLPFYFLASRYQPLVVAELTGDSYIICVTGSGFLPIHKEVPSHNFTVDAGARFHEGLRVAVELRELGKDYHIVISVPGIATESEKRTAVDEMIQRFNIPPEKITVESSPQTTRDEANVFQKHKGEKILVTSDYHMPRLMVLSRKYDLDGIPAPTGVVGYVDISILDFIPDAQNILLFQRTVNELLGMLEYAAF